LCGELPARAVEAHSKEPNTERSFILELTDECGRELAQKDRAHVLYLSVCYVTAFMYTDTGAYPRRAGG
jgi:hypothetical protein